MASFSATDAAFAGFRIVRERPGAVLLWALLLLVVQVGFSLAMVGEGGPAIAQMQALSTQPTPDPAQTMALMRQFTPLYSLLFLFALIFYPMMYATIDRAVLRPEEHRFGYLRLGVDELLQLALMVILFFVAVGFEIVFFIVVLITAGVIGVVAHYTAAPVAGIFGVVAVVGVICGFIYVLVRLSLASAVTFATRDVNPFASWSVTRGHFWAILGTYMLTWIFVLLVGLLSLIVIFAVVAIAGGGLAALGTVLRPDFSSLKAYASPLQLIYYAGSAILSALIWPLLLAPQAAIYKALTAAAPPAA